MCEICSKLIVATKATCCFGVSIFDKKGYEKIITKNGSVNLTCRNFVARCAILEHKSQCLGKFS